MVLADVGLFELIWTTLFILMLVVFIGLIIFVVRDLFRDHEMSGWAKVGWLVAVVIFPILGSLVYLIARGGGTRGDRLFEDSAARAHRTRTEVERQARRDADSTRPGPVED
jgi:Phospholipase_D-nuclease N-terminal